MTHLTALSHVWAAAPRLAGNPRLEPDGGFPFDRARHRDAIREMTAWPEYGKTPLKSLSGLAGALGLDAVWYKDEAGRFGLGSFKGLGAGYAVSRHLRAVIQKHTGRADISLHELRSERFKEITDGMTVCCATDGNHGRAVAWAAACFGCRSIVFLHEHVSSEREAAIAGQGAEIRRVPGTYDDSVRAAAATAAAEGWQVISDTSYPGYTSIPEDIMYGYTVMTHEIRQQIPAEMPPTHVFVQGGVGGLAAAVVGHLTTAWPGHRPIFVVVEPDRAACLFESNRQGAAATISGDLETIMAGLSCGEASPVAWRVLDRTVDYFQTISDEMAADIVRLLARGLDGDPPVAAGESAVAGLAGAIHILTSNARPTVFPEGSTRLLVIGSEGVTDRQSYERIVGSTP